MPRRVNLTVLLGLIVVIVLSFGLSAGAQPGDGSEAERGAGAEADPFGVLEEKRKAADIAHAEHQNAVFEENRVNKEIAETRRDLADTEQRLAEAEDELGDRASQIYKENDNLRIMDALLGARSLSEFTQVTELLLRQIDNDREEVRQLRGYRDTLQQQEEELNSQVEDRREILEDASAKKEEAEVRKAEAQEFVDSLGSDELEDLEEEEARRARETAEEIRKLLTAQEERPAEDSDEALREEGQDAEAGEASAEQAPPMTEEDEQRQAMVAQAVDEVIGELVAVNGKPSMRKSDETAEDQEASPQDKATGNQGTSPQNLLAALTLDTANMEEEANRKASEAAEQVAAEQEAQKKVAQQTEAVENAKRLAQEAPEQQRQELQAAADQAQLEADQAAKEAAEIKAAAEKSAKEAAGQRESADQAAMRLAEERVAQPLAGELPLSPVTGSSEGQPGVAGGLPTTPTIGTGGANVAPSGFGAKVIDQADNLLGVPYVAGGNTPASGLDCSAFTKWVYGKFGISLTDSPAGQMGQGTPVDRAHLRPGDLVFFDESGRKGSPTHVGIYMGNNEVIHASNFTGDVTVTNMDYIKGFLQGNRLL